MKIGLAVLTSVVVAACTGDGPTRPTQPGASAAATTIAAPRAPRHFTRIAVVGASVSVGFGGVALDDAFRAAAKGATVTSAASLTMFKDAVTLGQQQIDAALAAKPDLVVAVDFLFWHVYNGRDRDDRLARLDRGLADLERARAAGAHVIVGDVPRIVTASELLIPRDAVPPADVVAAANARIRSWAAARSDTLVVPFQAWAEPLAAGAEVEVAPGERRPARDLMSIDGLHPNPLGVWWVMTGIDALVEQAFAVPADDWAFARPAS